MLRRTMAALLGVVLALLPALPASAESPSPAPTGRPASHGGLAVVVVLIAAGVVATIWIRRAAARYRKSLD